MIPGCRGDDLVVLPRASRSCQLQRGREYCTPVPYPAPETQSVPYLVRKGTRIIVRKPSGEVAQHACRDDTVFHAFEKVSELKTLQFKRDGFVVTVAAADVVEVSFKCPQCGGKSEVEGLCECCRERWLPGR